tara:strand:+ start:5550 stop:6476 length:927 start_codon:yes stop_codon:yes gene_type:complete
MSDKIVIKLDASACKKSACDRLFYFNVIEGLSQVHGNDLSMHYGKAVHLFAELYPANKDAMTTMFKVHEFFRATPTDEGKKEWLSINHLTQTCMRVKDWIDADTNAEYYVNPVDSKPMCEVRFGIPYRAYPHVDILLCGTIDKVVKMKRGASLIGDYKTTSTFKVDDYFTQYRLDPQMMLYRYAMEWYAKHTKDNVLAEIGSQRLGTFIDGIFLSKAKDTEIRRSSIMFYSDSEMEDFEYLLNESCDKIAKWAVDRQWPRKQGMFNGSCTHLYGACKYFGVCSAPDKQASDAMIRNYFVKKTYDPLAY